MSLPSGAFLDDAVLEDNPPMPVHGSCLCGGIRFRLTAPFRRANYCHCSRCQKHSGSNASAQGRVPKDQFELLGGEDLLTVYEPQDGGMSKVFCKICGSSLFGGTWPDGPEVSVRLGSLDDDPGIQPQYHSHTASIPAWDHAPDDGLPRFGGRPSKDLA
jgi:hypothetical protein